MKKCDRCGKEIGIIHDFVYFGREKFCQCVESTQDEWGFYSSRLPDKWFIYKPRFILEDDGTRSLIR
jgi:hypothetical protein